MASKNKLLKNKIGVTFLPEGKKVTSFESVNLKEVISKTNIKFSFPCGGEGICKKCKVKIKGNVNPPTQKEKKSIPELLKKGYRLACQIILKGNVEVTIPKSSLISTFQILTTNLNEIVKVNSSIKKVYCNLAPPTLKDQTSDVSRIKKEFKEKGMNYLEVGVDLVKKIPFILRKSNFKVTCVLDGEKLIALERGDTRGKKFGMAFDIGTTTIVGSLIDLDTGERITTKAILNPQIIHGHDVISRISYIQQRDSKALWELQKRVIGGINELVGDLIKEVKVKKSNVYQITLVGNTVMQHLLTGINPLSLALYPYVPVIQDGINIKSSQLKIKINPLANVYVFPNIAAFIGGDTVGVILSTELHKKDEKTRLAVDIGTNGEIVLSHKGKLIATSTAAGPAFEGTKISQGMWAQKGAIERVRLKKADVLISVIGKGEAKGICGSGLVDVISELYREKIIDSSGRIKPLNKQKKIWINRIVEGKEGSKFVLCEGENKTLIYISQKDIREFQLAKAAIYTGIKILLKILKIEKDEVEEFLVAGAFGNYMNVQNAYSVGLFPFFPRAQVRTVGNAANFGAIIALLSQDSRREAERIPSLVHPIELANSSDFQDTLIESMSFSDVN